MEHYVGIKPKIFVIWPFTGKVYHMMKLCIDLGAGSRIVE